jgi:hypothetical protein
MNRRQFLKNGLRGTAAYALLPATILGSHNAMAGKDSVKDHSSDSVTEEEIEYLMYMREEEKLARDVYLTMYAKWKTHVFSNIADSEELHTLAVKSKIDKYGLEDPVDNDDVGIFVNEKLAKLYDTLIDQGNKSEMDALWVGAAIEEIDMIDLQEAIDAAEHPDIAKTYQSLMDGSKNHLRAFVSVIETQGMDYSAQYLDQHTVDAILKG